MEVPQEVLEKLKCIDCGNYLSCGPVKIRHKDGNAFCGRCTGQEEETSLIQNNQYETLAEIFIFPCKYSEFGCTEKLKFSKNKQSLHEENCEYRKRLCPIAESGKCDWLDNWKNILQHCKEKHSDKILENPCIIHHDITKSSMINYLLVAFNLLFVLHTKICCSSGKIFHSIRLLGNSGKADEFEYQLNIKRNREQQSKLGTVFAEGSLVIEERSSLSLSINSLLEFFGGFKDTTFEITLKQLVPESSTALNENFFNRIKPSKCVQCDEIFNSSSYTLELIELCEKCKKVIYICENKNKGCRYYDFKEKCLKHGDFYCEFITECTFCKLPIKQGTMLEHLEVNHLMLKQSINESIRCFMSNQTRYLLSSNIGTIVFGYSINDNATPSYKIYTPLKSKELRHYNCFIQIEATQRLKYVKLVASKHDTERKEDWSFTALENSNTSFFEIRIRFLKL